ncbi:beta-lactamase family protein [Dyadobacter jejuensis]|uniref:Beta-lactamase family protein n=1 Tax=Dyadobacter jejuensis TaxID=1082580 RepID=A0A316ASE0_9BACT|nr:serine hydrolase [Dyadobacter jejuensis]PWJ60341.1 beta-lactamase family protein [Dyadobacter jejuensis]
MNSTRDFWTIIFLVSALSVGQVKSQNLLTKLMQKHPERFEQVFAEPEKFQVQVRYTRIDRKRNNDPHFTTFDYGVDPNQYFYPASTVKLAVVALALERLNKLGIDKYTPMLTGADRPSQTVVLADSSSESGLPSVGHYAKKILMVSDNDAFNRLYEFLGQEAINDSLKAKGYSNTRITHRLSIALSAEENRYTNPVTFKMDGKVLWDQPGAYSQKTYWAPEPIYQGKGHLDGEDRVSMEPFDFSQKNYFPIAEQHQLLRALYFPLSVPESQRFQLSDDDYTFLYRYMSQFPVETSFPKTYTDDYYDGFSKFLLFGATKTRLPRHIRLFNKSGGAYGYLLDNAYVADFEKGIEFMVTAVIYCNQNEIIGDGVYEYDSIGLPFLANLGKTIFEYELERKRKMRPDLDRFEVEYDK